MIPASILDKIDPRRSGRPRDDEDREEMHRIGVNVTRSKRDELDALADRIGVQRTVLLRAMVDDLLEQARADERKAA